MKNNTALLVVAAVVVVGGGFYLYKNQATTAAPGSGLGLGDIFKGNPAPTKGSSLIPSADTLMGWGDKAKDAYDHWFGGGGGGGGGGDWSALLGNG